MGRPKKVRFMATRAAVYPTEQPRKFVNVKQFRGKCGELMNEVARTGTELVVTKGGEPHVIVTPAARRVGNTFIGSGRPARAAARETDGAVTEDAFHAQLLAAWATPVPLVPPVMSRPSVRTPRALGAGSGTLGDDHAEQAVVETTRD